MAFAKPLLITGAIISFATQAPSKPLAHVQSIDPLVAVSLLANQQSRAAVCASDAPAKTAAAQSTNAKNCVERLKDAAAAVPEVPVPPPAPPTFGFIPLLPIIAVVGGGTAAVAIGGSAGNDLTPISPN